MRKVEQQPQISEKQESIFSRDSDLKAKKNNIIILIVIGLAAVMFAVLIAGVCGVFPSGSSNASSQDAASVMPGTAASGDVSSGASAAQAAGGIAAESAASKAASSGSSSSGQASTAGSRSDQGYVLPPASSGSGKTASSSQGRASSAHTASAPSEEEDNAFPAESANLAPASSAAIPDSYSGSAVSRAEFDSLKTGMTYDDVVAAVGGSGTIAEKNGAITIYEWKGYGSEGAYARISFKSGKLFSKYQFGL